MKIVLAPDSFKGSLSAPDAARAMADGLRRVWPDADLVLLPVADGGEGTLETLIAATGGRFVSETVVGPLGEPVTARWGLFTNSAGEATAVVELAEAAGLARIAVEWRNPKITQTTGVGQLISRALATSSVRRLIIGLGGSATNDGGAGVLTALGVQLQDAQGIALPAGGAALANLVTIVGAEAARAQMADVAVQIACDVNNPLCGPRGASAVFGPQKGATPADIVLLDAALTHFARVLRRFPASSTASNADISTIPGSGAAGGAATALLYLAPHARLQPGIEIVLDAVDFDAQIADADLIFTGEGRLDAQTLGGKVVAGVARRARAARGDGAGVPVVALVGGLTGDVDGALLADLLHVRAVMPVVPAPCSLSTAIAEARPFLTDAAERAARWLQVGAHLPKQVNP